MSATAHLVRALSRFPAKNNVFNPWADVDPLPEPNPADHPDHPDHSDHPYRPDDPHTERGLRLTEAVLLSLVATW